MIDFDYDADRARYELAYRCIARYAKPGETHKIGLKHLKVAMDALRQSARDQTAMKIIRDAAKLLERRKDDPPPSPEGR